jgi:hypothetical protein
MSDRVDYTEWEYNQWRSVQGGDGILGKSEPQGFRSGKNNRTRNLWKGLRMFRYKTLQFTYDDTNVKSEHNALYIGLVS